MDELSRLERQEMIRILDLLFVQKDAATGDLLALDYQREDLGTIVGALLGFEFEGDGDEQSPVSQEVESHAFGLSRQEIKDMAASLAPGSSASSSSSTCGRATSSGRSGRRAGTRSGKASSRPSWSPPSPSS